MDGAYAAAALFADQGLALHRRGGDEPMAQNVTQDELYKKATCSFNMAECCPSGLYAPCRIERPEHLLVQRHVDPKSTGVLELGGRYGTTTCELARQLQNSGKVVAVEPDSKVWPSWQANVVSHHCRANLVKGIVGGKGNYRVFNNGYGSRVDKVEEEGGGVEATPWEEVQKQFGVTFDTLLIDCEGCVNDFLAQNPGLLEQVNTILLEADMGHYRDSWSPTCSNEFGRGRECVKYDHLIANLEASGFKVMESFKESEIGPDWEFAEGMNHIYHLALKRV